MNNTIFDDVFRTMVEKIPRLVIPLINEVFHTSYPEDVEECFLRRIPGIIREVIICNRDIDKLWTKC